jgi:hypothetical protein
MAHREHDGWTDLRIAGIRRLDDAEALLDSGQAHGQGAAYLAGYAVECKLKCIAMEGLSCWTLTQLARKWKVDERDVYTHGLEYLVKRLPSYQRFRQSSVWPVFVTRVSKWRPSWRYSPYMIAADVRAFVQAVRRVIQWLDANG